ncbi:efflux transporter outer membrane subunit [Methylosoma difficile]
MTLRAITFSCRIALATSLLVGCTLGPDFSQPAAPALQSKDITPVAGDAVSKSGVSQSLIPGKDIPGLWWALFQSPQLNALIEKGLKHSPDLQAAQAALSQARELAIAKKGALFPSVDAGFTGNRQKTSGAQFGNPSFGGSLFTLYNASVQVSYTLDVFGAVQRQIEQLDAQAEYQQFQLEAAFLTLAGNIATTAIQEASLRAQIDATQAMIDTQSRQLEVIQQQIRLGSAAPSALLAQQAALAQTRTQLPPLQQQLAQTRHLLNLLVGDLPNANAGTFKLSDLHLPAQLPLSLPAKWVEHRPDIRAQASVLHAANAQIGVVTASIFPDFTLTASAGSIATEVADLFIPGSYIWNVGGKALQPIFRGGEFTHNRTAAIAAYEQVAAQYKGTVLKAFHHVADSLNALHYDAAEADAQSDAVQTAAASLALLQAQYAAGAVSYLQVLDAERTWQQAQIGDSKAQAARLADTVALFQALGGGWWNRPELSKTLIAERERQKPKAKTTFSQDIHCFLHACLDNGKLLAIPSPSQENHK